MEVAPEIEVVADSAANNADTQVVDLTENTGRSKRWSPSSLQDTNRKSAFLPYKQNVGTVLTNLQRGNTQAETPIPLDVDINFHTRAGQGEITQNDIKNEASIDICDTEGLTALHWASAYGQIASVQLLLDFGSDVNKLGKEGESPLLLAASGGHHDVIRLLINKGANLNHTDDIGNSALMYSAGSNHPHCCNELLVHGADVTLANHNGDTAYNLAVDHNSIQALAVIENHLLSILGAI